MLFRVSMGENLQVSPAPSRQTDFQRFHYRLFGGPVKIATASLTPIFPAAVFPSGRGSHGLRAVEGLRCQPVAYKRLHGAAKSRPPSSFGSLPIGYG
jgi:hypothetical protein